MRKDWKVLLMGVALVFVALSSVKAATPEGVEAKLKRLEQRISAQDQKIAAQDKTIENLTAKLSGKGVNEIKREEIKSIIKEMKADAGLGDMPNWLENLAVFGDFRLRYELIKQGADDSRNRGRFRLRLGAKKTWLEKQLEVGFRLATGSETGITSTNQSMDGSFDLKEFSVDRAYARYSPDAVKGLTVVGGKMKNPFFQTDMVWDSDVTPEGVWAIYQFQNQGPIRPFIGAGFFVIEEFSNAGDAELHAYELGATWVVSEGVKWTFAATYYDYGLYEKPGAFATAGNNTTDGSRLTADEFNIINLTNKVSWKAFELPMSAYFDYARNCGDETENMDDAFAVGVKVGKNKKKGDWSVSFKYAYIEANALPGAFPDADFGGTDRKGTVWRAKYNLTDSLTAGLSLFCTESIDDIDSNSSEFITQADLAWKF